jgi:hypothetical protein
MRGRDASDRTWKKPVVAYFEVKTGNFRGRTEKNREKPQSDSRSPGREPNQGPPEYEEGD